MKYPRPLFSFVAIRAGSNDTAFDFTGDDKVNLEDLHEFVTSADHLNTYFGDANLDGVFNTEDLVQVFIAGQYEDGIELNSTWATGDWDADAEFGTSDLVAAFVDGGYEKGPRAAAVPEPSSMGALGILIMVGLISRKRQRTQQLRVRRTMGQGSENGR